MSNTPKDRNGSPLEPGALYAAFVEGNEPGDPPRLVAYVYWTGAELIHDEGDQDTFDHDVDYLVRQAGATINEDVIDDSRAEAIAEERAEYRAAGGDL